MHQEPIYVDPNRTSPVSLLPGMADIHEPLALRVPLPVEIIVPGTQFGEGVLEEVPRLRLILRVPVDVEGGRGVKGGLDHARGLVVFGSVGALFGMPEVRSRKI